MILYDQTLANRKWSNVNEDVDLFASPQVILYAIEKNIGFQSSKKNIQTWPILSRVRVEEMKRKTERLKRKTLEY